MRALKQSCRFAAAGILFALVLLGILMAPGFLFDSASTVSVQSNVAEVQR